MYFPLEVGDVVIRPCNGRCEKIPSGWTHLNKGQDDAIFRMVVETQPGTNRRQRRAARMHKHRWADKNGTIVCTECGQEKDDIKV